MAETYSVSSYAQMVADQERTGAYTRALQAAVRPGCVVLDLGTGSGIMALLAARFGARRVFGIDPSDAIRTARETARANGLGDQVEFIQDISTRVTLPERADVIVFDLRGVLPVFQEVAATIADARERLLAPGGVLIPRSDTLMAAPVEAPDAWNEVAGPAELLGIDLTPARRAAVNEWSRGRLAPDQLLGEPAAWAVMDYHTLTDPDVRGSAAWTAARAGTAHGLALWFRAELWDGIGYDSGPGSQTIYQTAFFPWPQPVEVAPGDRIRADLQARLVSGDYVWFWNCSVERAGHPPIEFRQSTFASALPSPDRLRRHADSFRARLNDDGRLDAWILARMDGGATLGELAREMQAHFPERFATWESALAHAGRLSERYAE